LQLGIETVYTGENWKVLSVQESSPAKRSGVKTGDAVEAIDGEKLTDKPLQSKMFEGKKLTVVRDGQKIEISLGIKSN
jgi:predicted metalloprotease with PDZ domain